MLCGVPQKLDYCDEGTWLPPHVVADDGHEHRTCAYYPTKTTIGRCGPEADGSLGICSNFASRCDDPTAFESRDPTCSVTHDGGVADDEDKQKVEWQIIPFGGTRSASFRSWTTYGKCVGGESSDRCVWSPDDCVEGEAYVRNDPECTADKIEIGACLDGYGYCTVSLENCENPNGDFEPYYTHQGMLDTFDINCYLANLPKLIEMKPPTKEPTVSPTVAPTVAPVTSTAAPQLELTPELTSTSQNENGLSQGLIIGITVGFGLVLGVALGLFNSIRLKRLQKKKPVRVVRAQEIIIDDGEDLSVA